MVEILILLKKCRKKFRNNPPTPSKNPNSKYFIHEHPVKINTERVQYIGSDNKLTTKSIIDYTKKNILNEYANLNTFLNNWNTQKKRSFLIDELNLHATNGIINNYIKNFNFYILKNNTKRLTIYDVKSLHKDQ